MKQWMAMAALLLFGGFSQAHEGHGAHGSMVHLTFGEGAIHAHVTWESAPQVAAESVLRIDWKNGADHSPVEPPGAFDVVLWMPAMGHGSSPTRIEHLVDAQGAAVTGSYEVSNLYFVMGGDWEVRVTLTLADGTRETRIIPVQLSEDGDGHHDHH